MSRPGLCGHFPLRSGGGWDRRSFRACPVAPSCDLADPEVRLVDLVDLDGDGADDLVYVDDGTVLVWINRGGNGWSDEPIVIHGTPPLAAPDADLLGSGTDCLVWSSDAPTAGDEQAGWHEWDGGGDYWTGDPDLLTGDATDALIEGLFKDDQITDLLLLVSSTGTTPSWST